ncbi:MAG: hypothetical protein AMXMBFR84_38150 [Candidatus Hydrogenedentota bacterium]
MSKTQFGITLVAAMSMSFLGGAVSIHLFSATPVFAAAGSGLEASEFRLIDADGNVRASLGVDSGNNVRLTMSDANQITRIWTGITAQGTAMFNLRDAKGESRIFLQVDEKEPLLSMRDAQDKGRVFLQVTNDEPLFNLRDKNDKGRFFVKVDDQGPIMWFHDEDGKPIFTQR